ncbi:ATP-citrate synthase-like [Diadema antillarum]|uniref:ATP-citrate synthase-like n=1 Tax=Diadema antillarum TaxID=105358 RepID=UPI003A87504C
MSSKTVTEVYGKRLLSKELSLHVGELRCACVSAQTDWDSLIQDHPWLCNEALVIKPDQGLKRRGKLGLLKLNTHLDSARKWMAHKMDEEILVDGVSGRLRQFIIEPFVKHDAVDEYFLSIYSEMDHDVVLFHHDGGIDVGNVDEKALKLDVGLNEEINEITVQKALLQKVPAKKSSKLASFIVDLVKLYQEMHFVLLEINPLVVLDQIYPLDLAAMLDTKATPMCRERWGQVEFPLPFCRLPTKEERYISKLEVSTPASIKLTLLNKKARIWSIISGGGISLLFGDTARHLGCAEEIGCYAQFSGPVNADQMYGFTKTVIDLMLEEPHPDGKVLISGSQAIDVTTLLANRTGPGEGLMRALLENRQRLIENKVSLYIRTTVGLVGAFNERLPSSLQDLGFPVHVIGGEVPISDVINYALRKKAIPTNLNRPRVYTKVYNGSEVETRLDSTESTNGVSCNGHTDNYSPDSIFTSRARAVAIGMFPVAIQNILGFDSICHRDTPSIAAIVRPKSENTEETYAWKTGSITLPVYRSIADALSKHSDVTVVLNQAIGPAAYKCALYAVNHTQVRGIIMMVGQVTERQTRELIQIARERRVLMIGPCTVKHGLQVNVLKPGAFRCNLFGDIGGPLPDVIDLKLYRQGSVVYLSRSGGLSSELCASIARNSDGLYLGLALGGGRYTGSGIMDHINFLQDVPAVKCFILIGEVGGCEEYEICDALRSGHLRKPTIAFCIGTCVDLYKQEPAYFGHTGGGTDSLRESATVKNETLAAAGAIVPDTFEGVAMKLAELYDRLAQEGALSSISEPPVPEIPANLKPARRPPVLSN